MAITISGDGTITGITAGGLPDGIITADELASGVGGKVLQVVQGTSSSGSSTSSGTFVDTGLSASITPSSTSSKVAVIVFQPMFVGQSDSTTAWYFIQLLRGSTFLTKQHNQFAGSSTGQYTLPSHISYLDSPATTSSITYKTQCLTYNTQNTIYLNWDTSVSSMILMEIAG